MTGRILRSETLEAGMGLTHHQMEMENLKPGAYILLLKSGNQKASKKIMINK